MRHADTPTRDECREHFIELGLTYGDVSDSDVAALQIMLGARMRDCRKNPTGSYHETWKMSKRMLVKQGADGGISEAYLRCIVHPGSMRECVSFNRDGFIGFCGDFDDHNAAPILETFWKWCDVMASARRSG